MIKRLLLLLCVLGFAPPAFAARVSAMGCEFGTAVTDVSEFFFNAATDDCSTVAVRSGTYALRSNTTVAAIGGTELILDSSTNGTISRADGLGSGGDALADAYASGYVRVTTLPSAGEDIVQLQSSGEVRACGIHLGTTGIVTAVQADGTSVGTGPTIGTGEWWFINLRCSISATVGVVTLQMSPAGSGITRRPIQYVNVSNANTGALNIEEVGFGTLSAAATMDIYYDDWRIDTAAFPGPGRIALLQSTGNGTYTAWTGNCTALDEIPPTVTTADSVTSATLNQQESCTTVDPATSANGESIATVWAYVARDRSAGTGTPTINILLRDNAADRLSTASGAISATDVANVTQWATDNGGSAWADSDINGAELGVSLSVASSSTVRAFWIHGLVDVSQTARSGVHLAQ